MMRKFILESALFLTLVIITCYFILLRANGKSDHFYLHFTSPRQHSLILGNSRSAQGIQPVVLNEILSRNDIYNYSFTIGTSPYGPVYLKSVKKKLDHKTKDGIFILSVDPWSISSNSKDPNDPGQFKEKEQYVGKTHFVNMNPNFLYLFNSYGKSFYQLLPRQKSSITLHDDGWLEVKIKQDSASMQKRLERKIKLYREKNLKKYKFSYVRLDYLKETINYLKHYGNVYLVRLPVHPRIQEIDEELVPGFNEKMMMVSESTGAPYLDMSYLGDSLQFTDGNHIYRESVKGVSARIGEWIASHND